MGYYETSQGYRVKVLLTDEELQFDAIDDLCNKYQEWLTLSKEGTGGRKTRAANRRADTIYEEIMAFKLPPIELKQQSTSPIRTRTNSTKLNSVGSSAEKDSDTSVSRPITRSLRPRSQTPAVQSITDNQKQQRTNTAPSTPSNQRLRACMKQPASGTSSSGSSSNVLSAALNQQHPSVSVTKIRQLLRADSAQKRRDEERERQERIRTDRKMKEERAEAQKKQLLEKRAINAKLNREQRLMRAAEMRKAREEAKMKEKLKEDSKRIQVQLLKQQQSQEQQHQQINTNTATHAVIAVKDDQQAQEEVESDEEVPMDTDRTPSPVQKLKVNQKLVNNQPKVQNLNETFKKPSGELNNIDISIHDETSEDQKDKVQATAAWARAPHLREALIKQFSKPDEERVKEALTIFSPVKLPVELDKIFGSTKAVGTRYLSRTSSAVWTPPHRAVKRSSMVMTPNNDNH